MHRRGIPHRRLGTGRIWRGGARPAPMAWRGDPRARRRSAGVPPPPAWRARRHRAALPRGGRQRRADRLPVSAQRQSTTRPQIRLQAALVRTPDRPRRDAAGNRPADRAGRRLQRGPDRCRHLRHAILAHQRAAASRGASSLGASAGARLDRCPAQAASGRAHLHFLGLHARSLAPRCRPAAGSPAAQSGDSGAATAGRGGSGGQGCGERQRSRAGVGEGQRQGQGLCPWPCLPTVAPPAPARTPPARSADPAAATRYPARK